MRSYKMERRQHGGKDVLQGRKANKQLFNRKKLIRFYTDSAMFQPVSSLTVQRAVLDQFALAAKEAGSLGACLGPVLNASLATALIYQLNLLVVESNITVDPVAHFRVLNLLSPFPTAFYRQDCCSIRAPPTP